MQFELTYKDGSKATVTISDIEMRAWLEQKQATAELRALGEQQEKRGLVLDAKTAAP